MPLILLSEMAKKSRYIRCFTSIIIFQKYISLCSVLVTIVLALGVIIEESTNAAMLHNYFKEDSNCDDERVSSYRKKDCDQLKEADPWYYILLYTTDLVLVLCSFVMLLLFADWILFVAPVRLINCTVYCTLTRQRYNLKLFVPV